MTPQSSNRSRGSFRVRMTLFVALLLLALAPLPTLAVRQQALLLDDFQLAEPERSLASAPVEADYGACVAKDGAAAAQVPPAPPAPPVPPAPPAPPAPPPSGVVGHVPGDAEGTWWAYIEGDRVVMHGQGDDPRVAALRAGGPVFWFVQDGREYVVRDEATLREVEQLVASVNGLGLRQAELGAQQAALGARQAELGGKQAELAGRQAASAAKQATEATHAASAGTRGPEEAASQQAGTPVDKTARGSGASNAELGRSQRELAKRQEELAAQQQPMAAEQAALAARAEEASARMEREIATLIAKTLADGRAKPLKEQ